MGTYNYSENMLIEKLVLFLDKLEGDFDGVDLSNALEFMKHYCPTSDSCIAFEKRWRKMLKEKLGSGEWLHQESLNVFVEELMLKNGLIRIILRIVINLNKRQSLKDKNGTTWSSIKYGRRIRRDF